MVPSVSVLDTHSISSHEVPVELSEVPEWQRGCGRINYVTLYCAHCGHEHKAEIGCGNRACPDCRAVEAKRLKAKYMPLIEQVPVEKMALVTLTLLITSSDGLREKVDRIRGLWRKLIRQKAFRPVAGGLYVIEVKRAAKVPGGWNVHIHAMAEAKGFLRHWKDGNGRLKADILGQGAALTMQRLSAAWKGLTGDSAIVDITPFKLNMGGSRGALNYVLKYMTKSDALNLQSLEDRFEYNRSVKGVRLINTFGSWSPTSKNYRFIDDREGYSFICPECGQNAGYWISEFDLRKKLLQFGEGEMQDAWSAAAAAVAVAMVYAGPEYVQEVIGF